MRIWQQHLNQAEHNEQFAASLDMDTTPFRDWVVTALFYAALHYLCAYLAHERYTDYARHNKITYHMRRDPKLAPNSQLRRYYKDLKNDSEEARYRFKTLSPRDVTELRDVQLRTVRDTIRGLLP